MYTRIFLLFLFSITPLFGFKLDPKTAVGPRQIVQDFGPVPTAVFRLKDRVDQIEAQDYIVYAHKSSFTLLTVRAVADQTITLEEITGALAQMPSNWQKWLDEQAPFHTSWTTYVIDKKTFAVIDTEAKADDELREAPPILTKLLSLELTPIAASDRKKIGPQPLPGEVDLRKIWSPKIIFNNKEVQTHVSGYTLVWPKDDSELSGRMLVVYVPDSIALPYLPYWIEVLSGPLKFKVFAIDSGKKLKSRSSKPDQI